MHEPPEEPPLLADQIETASDQIESALGSLVAAVEQGFANLTRAVKAESAATRELLSELRSELPMGAPTPISLPPQPPPPSARKMDDSTARAIRVIYEEWLRTDSALEALLSIMIEAGLVDRDKHATLADEIAGIVNGVVMRHVETTRRGRQVIEDLLNIE